MKEETLRMRLIGHSQSRKLRLCHRQVVFSSLEISGFEALYLFIFLPPPFCRNSSLSIIFSLFPSALDSVLHMDLFPLIVVS